MYSIEACVSQLATRATFLLQNQSSCVQVHTRVIIFHKIAFFKAIFTTFLFPNERVGLRGTVAYTKFQVNWFSFETMMPT